jgi:hypothetical protein
LYEVWNDPKLGPSVMNVPEPSNPLSGPGNNAIRTVSFAAVWCAILFLPSGGGSYILIDLRNCSFSDMDVLTRALS